MTTATDRLLDVVQAAEWLGTTERFPRRLIAERRIRFVRVGRHVRIPESALADFITANTVEPMRRSRQMGRLMAKRRNFGYIGKMRSGRWQASYLDAGGVRRYAPSTFERKGDASAWLSIKQAELLAGDWVDPERGRVPLSEYAARWIRERDLAVQTRDGYRSLKRLHIDPFLGNRYLSDMSPEVVRSWRAQLLVEGRSAGTAAKAYRLLRSVLTTATEDGRIKVNPCRIKGAGDEPASSRHVASIRQVYALADAVGDQYRVFVLTAAFTSMRWAELVALRRQDVDLDGRVVYVRRSFVERSGGMLEKLPKGDKPRVVTLPQVLIDGLREHLAERTDPEPSGLVFTGTKGGSPRRSSWRVTVGWKDARKAAGLPDDFHFHDLRHTGNHLMAQSGASTRELMDRMGHSTMRAALIYQHATHERARELADKLDALVSERRNQHEA